MFSLPLSLCLVFSHDIISFLVLLLHFLYKLVLDTCEYKKGKRPPSIILLVENQKLSSYCSKVTSFSPILVGLRRDLFVPTSAFGIYFALSYQSSIISHIITRPFDRIPITLIPIFVTPTFLEIHRTTSRPHRKTSWPFERHRTSRNQIASFL